MLSEGGWSKKIKTSCVPVATSLGQRGAGGAIRAVADEYERQTGHRPYVFSGSSPGAAAFGHLKLTQA